MGASGLSETDRAGRTPLHYAALEGRVGDVVRLLREGANPDALDREGFAPLHFAAQEYQVEATRALLDGGASVEVANRFGNTPLSTATFNSNGRGDIIVMLREAGADPLHVNKFGQTPVGLARLIANYDVAQYFADLPEQDGE